MDHLERERKRKELQAWYLGELDRELAVFRDLLARAVGPADPVSAPWRELRRLAHNWRGSGGSYGFPAWTAAAAPLEGAIDARAPIDEIAGCFERALLVYRALCSDFGER